MVTEDIDINEFYWGVKTKFKLEIGLKNNLKNQYAATENSIYPEIVWFPQGTYVVTTFNTSITTNNCTISLSGKDKMCMLNGDLGGQLFASIDFGTEETEIKQMKLVSNITNVSSDTLMVNRYYKKLTAETCTEVIFSSDSLYSLIPSKNGFYYKIGNKYMPLSDLSLNVKKYEVYKLVTDPTELFEEIDISTVGYEKDKYYYEKTQDSKYYILDQAINVSDRTYYKLISLYEEDYSYEIVQIPLEKIIREAVHAYAKEPYHNIIINDLDDYGLEQVTYKGDTPLLVFRNADTEHFTQVMLAKNFTVYYDDEDYHIKKGNDEQYRFIHTDSETQEETSYDFLFDPLVSETTSVNGTLVHLNKNQHIFYLGNQQSQEDTGYFISLIDYGDDLGYRVTDLVYTGDLISSLGDTLVTILDKIKTMLGDFEYFYDLQGHFVFQRKRTYVNTSWSQLTKTEDETYIDYVNSDRKKFSFNFEGNRLITAIQNSPNLSNLRNDFSVWGKRKTVTGAEIPIHARYAIDKKPVYYQALNGKIYTTDEKYIKEQLNLSYDNITSDIYEKIQNFSMEYSLPSFLQGQTPQQNENGSWSPGWWDIRDWARFYMLLTDDSEFPNGTMKFYSRGDETGCIPVKLLGSNFTNYNDDLCVWLIDTNEDCTSINLGHGMGVFGRNQRPCTYYTSRIEDGSIVYTATDIKKNFYYPYAGCSDNHTYLYFLNRVENYNRRIYFYNPDFPNISYEQLLEEKIDTSYARWKEKNQFYIVDWREIIYQMALDFFAGQGCSVDEPIYLTKYENYILTTDTEMNFSKIYYLKGNEGFYKVNSQDIIDYSLLNPYAQGYYEKYISYDNNNTNEDALLITYLLDDPDHFFYEVASRNPYYYPTGITGYEQYYTDIEGFWRQLYNPDYIPVEKYQMGEYEVKERINENSIYYSKIKEWVDIRLIDYDIDYYVEAGNSIISQQYNKIKTELRESEENSQRHQILQQLMDKYNRYRITTNISSEFYDEEKLKRLYWNKNVFENPESLNFWFEFFDNGTELQEFSVPQVGDRSKIANEDKARAIIYKEIPDIILYDTFNENGNQADLSKIRKEITENSGYTFIYLPKGFSQYLTISYRGTSVKNKVDEFMYDYAYCIENISITAIPIYYLEPNTRIYVQDKTTQINGEYIVNKITLPLTHNGTMSITAVKAPERLY